ncbi:LuxR C-terminal-related transcriptional regulator [Ktedonobacter racemifer]|uniref:ATP-dependent transcriptional regulator, MalT-like, LuxR family n=1 Tax=Ktedonobacter racemifer DSM 44963 TaxID=485913 RepID=D6TBS5_KTERA|nr:LuxR C-terminal-related transcriptional regulator [Ktedonobacter racemifer]EFH89857.1 ATP-dependent transcriptional regulator, MalT-like, LuxR family [Ktedonobacter racemifer DSM 44963]
MDESQLFHDQLLATKFFIPSSSHALIPRPRLIELLNTSLECALTLVSAPAGFGKTTLLSTWIRSLPPERPQIAWVSLDEGDNEPTLFWRYAFTALDSRQPGLCTQLITYLQTHQAPPLRSVLQTLMNRLAEQSEQFLLILDDYHLITEQAIHTSLSYLVEHLPPQLHLILATRADPPLPISLLRARGHLLEVRTDQLRCSPDEVKTFLKKMARIHLSQHMVEEVATRIEGWLVGLQLLALSLQGLADPSDLLKEVSGSQRYIFDYLIEEVFQRQSPSVQTFLLHTSILRRFSAPLCDAILEQSGSQQMLEQLERANLFIVSLDTQRHWYRYHILFAKALRHLLEQTQPALVPLLHHRAGQWYAQHGRLNEAISHTITAQEWQLAADLIEQVSILIWGSSEHAMLRRWLEKLPTEMIRSRPRLCLAYAKTLFMVSSYTTIERWLQDAETTLGGTSPTLTNEAAGTGAVSLSEQRLRDNLLGEITAYRAIITGYYLGEGHSTLAFCQEALTHLAEQSLLARAEVAYAQSLAYHSFGDIVAATQGTKEATALAQAAGDTSSTILYMCRTAYSLLLRGKLHEVVQIAQQAALLGTTPVGLPHAMMCWAYIFHADVLREWNRLDEALELVLQGVQLSEQTETIVALYLGYTLLMGIHLAREELDAARLAYQKAEEVLAKTYSPYRRDAYLIVHWVQFWLAGGELERARNWAQERAQQANVHSPLACEREDVARARILLAQKMPTEALSLLDSLQVRAEKQERWSHVIEMKVLQALAHSMCDEDREACAILAQAVQLAEPENYTRIFVDEGARMKALLSHLREQERKKGPTAYLDALLAAFSSESVTHISPKGGDQSRGRIQERPLVEPLSERELEVLHLIARGDSNQKIAEMLMITLDTVKRHVTHIFEKLGVSNRVQAVARARALDWLSDER